MGVGTAGVRLPLPYVGLWIVLRLLLLLLLRLLLRLLPLVSLWGFACFAGKAWQCCCLWVHLSIVVYCAT